MANLQITRPRPDVTLITLDRPEKLNALSYGLVEDLLAKLSIPPVGVFVGDVLGERGHPPSVIGRAGAQIDEFEKHSEPLSRRSVNQHQAQAGSQTSSSLSSSAPATSAVARATRRASAGLNAAVLRGGPGRPWPVPASFRSRLTAVARSIRH